MNLLNDKWIPAKRANGSKDIIAPCEIGADENPVIEINAPRPDFRGALYQFLIGLVQTTFAPEDDDEWKERWENPPSCEELKKAFEKFEEAFELVNENGPAFMQDADLSDNIEESDIQSLLIGSPGGNTIKNNQDHFIKRDSITGLCDACTATALFTLQTNAPAGGQGHRTSLRGGGPLSTLVIADDNSHYLWNILWLNILTLDDQFQELPKKAASAVFPWMGPTIESKNDKQVYPEMVNILQLYWGTPRRIKLSGYSNDSVCNICGKKARIWTRFKTINYGVKYSSSWLHPLSPYRFQEEKDASINLLAYKGKQGGFSYPDWLSLTLIDDPKKEQAAKIIRSFIERKQWTISKQGFRIWCFGFDMDNMKARCWYDQTMPLLSLEQDKRFQFISIIQKMVSASSEVARLLRDEIKFAWFKRPKDIGGDTSFILSSFWEETESQFYEIAYILREEISKGDSTAAKLSFWHKIIIDTAERLFDRFALQETDEPKNMKRIAEAAKALHSILHSPKTKSIQALKEVV